MLRKKKGVKRSQVTHDQEYLEIYQAYVSNAENTRKRLDLTIRVWRKERNVFGANGLIVQEDDVGEGNAVFGNQKLSY